jgi:TolC family type I secretion outer membrane protein
LNFCCVRGLAAGCSAIALASLLSPVARAQPLTLQQALAAAYETNTQLQAQRAALRATDEDVATALSGWRPTVTVTASYGYTRDRTQPPDLGIVAPNGHPRDAGITLTQPIINGTTIPQTEQAKAGVEAGRAQLTSVEQSTLLNAARAYFDVLSAEAQLNYKRHNVSRLNDQVQMTQQRVAIHDLARSDLDIVQARLSAASADVATAEGNLAAAQAAFLRVIGRPAETLETAPQLPTLPATEQDAMSVALANNPDLMGTKYLVKQADAAVTVAYGALAPSVSAQLGYKKSADELGPDIRDDSLSAIVQLRVPLYQSGTEYAQIRRSVELRSKAVLQAADEERIVRQSLDAAWQTLVAARNAMSLDRQQVQSAQSAYDGILVGLRAGERTTFDVLNTEQDLDGAQVALVEAERQYNETTFQLLAATGGLTARALQLPVTFYDPKAHYDRDAHSWVGTGR